MAQQSKNARAGSSTQKVLHSCGGEIKMKSMFSSGKMKHYAECDSCKQQERRPSDFF
ncbi:hypothetical protein P0082_08055 [Candidatus Haliotispira prima]|uniref:Uncharacterized protein n=1 Tax=Candidatus Haliotispira prima TaxID=3034016 RepID=A0ABY8MEV7_9SPIO|nr:hypothetical protein P0082_08055 [Candidatus Haliotispira prima]